jgi:hypothetical protein
MTRALLMATLYLSSAIMVLVSATDAPSHPKRTGKVQIPRGLLEKDSVELPGSPTCSESKPCASGSICWYVALTFIILITCHYPVPPNYLNLRYSIADAVSLL